MGYEKALEVNRGNSSVTYFLNKEMKSQEQDVIVGGIT